MEHTGASQRSWRRLLSRSYWFTLVSNTGQLYNVDLSEHWSGPTCSLSCGDCGEAQGVSEYAQTALDLLFFLPFVRKTWHRSLLVYTQRDATQKAGPSWSIVSWTVLSVPSCGGSCVSEVKVYTHMLRWSRLIWWDSFLISILTMFSLSLFHRPGNE